MYKKYFLTLLIFSLIISFACGISCKKEKTAPPPGAETVEVNFVSPKGSVYRPNNIVVTFNAPMVPISTIGKMNDNGPIVLTPGVKGTFHWLGTQTVSFVPDEPFPFATKYSVQIKDDLSNIYNSRLKEPVSWEFETARPLLLKSKPAAGDTRVSLDENILLEFNQPVDPGTLRSHLRVSQVLENDELKEMRFNTKRPDEKIWKDEWKKDPGKIDNAVIVFPQGKLPFAAKIQLTISADLVGTEGELPAGKEETITFSTYDALKIKKIACTSDCNPRMPIDIEFNNSVKPSEAVKHVTIEPKIEIDNQAEWETNYFGIYGKFQPATTYEVTLSPKLTDVHGNKLGKEEKIKYSTGNYRPFIAMTTGYGVVESKGPKNIPLTVMNVDTIEFRRKVVSKESIAPIIRELRKTGIYSEDPLKNIFSENDLRVINLPSQTNKEDVVPISLNKLLDGKKTGIVIADISSPEIYRKQKDKKIYHHNKIFVQITDIGITGKFTDDSALIWATSLSDGKPIPGADVELRTDNGSLLWSGTTDETGLAKATIKPPKDKSGSSPVIIAYVEKEGDLAFSMSDWSEGFYSWDFGIWENYGDKKTKGYLFTERGIYKPGESIKLKAIIRNVTDKGISIPNVETGKITATDGRGRKFFDEELTISDYGTLGTEIKIPDYAATGSGSVSLNIVREKDGKKQKSHFRTGYQIAEYKPAEFKVEMEPEEKDVVAGDKIDVGIEASYLFGEPMMHSEAEWQIFRNKSSFSSKEFEDYTFDLSIFEEEKSDIYGLMDLEGKNRDKLNDEGEIEIVVPIKTGSVPQTTDYVIEATVTDINKRTISGYTEVTVHPGDFYIGLKSSSFIITAGEAFNVDVITTDIDGKLTTGRDVEVKLLKREWHTAKKKAVVGYTYETKAVDNEVAKCDIETADKPLQCKFTPKSSGLHIVKATAKDGRGNNVATSTGLFAAGEGIAGWKPESHDRIDLITDKKSYVPGETAKILVKSPFESAEALVTYERNGIIKQETMILNGYAPTITVPITDQYIPNFYVSVVMVKGRVSGEISEAGVDEGRPRVKVGYINLPVSPETKRINVAVEADKKEASPGDKINVSVKLSDDAGSPVKGEVAIMAVDTGSLILTSYKTPNPFKTFYAEQGLGVTTADSRIHLIERRHYGVKGEPVGGGGGADVLYRKKFLPVAYWNPSVKTDENGEAKISFELPDNLTTFKIMAVANTVDKFGSGDTEVISKKPFILRASLPYFAAVGDIFEAGVIIQNYSGGELSGSLYAKGEELMILSNESLSYDIPKKGRKEFFFKFKTEKIGTAKLKFHTDTETGSDGIEVPLKIKVTQPKETVTSYGQSETSAKEMFEPLENIYPDVGGILMSAASSAMNGLFDPSLYLVNYPYECLEQKLSRAIGMMYYLKIAQYFDMDDDKIETYWPRIEKIIFELYNFQKWNGGFSFWKGLREDPYLTIYATHFLTIAKDEDFDVSDKTYNKAKKYLVEMLRWNAKEKGFDETYLNSLKAYAVYVLSLAGEPETAYHQSLYKVRESLPVASRAQLMLAIQREVSARGQKEDFIQFINNHLNVTAGGAHIKDENNISAFRSSYYTDAYVILALLNIDPNYPQLAKMARYLLTEAKRGYWAGTHTTAAVLTSLYNYFKTKESVTPDFTVDFKLGDKTLKSADFEDKTPKEEKINIEMQDLVQLKKQTEILFEKEGPGLMYYRTRLTYASSEKPLPPMEEGFTIFKRYQHYDKDREGKDFERGDVVKVHLEFVAPETRQYVVINDWLPAGLEAVNFSLATAQKSLKLDSPKKFRIDHVETYGDKVLIFINLLPAGSYEFEYIAKASTKGEFTVPPVQIEEMYSPEVFGRSMTSELEVK